MLQRPAWGNDWCRVPHRVLIVDDNALLRSLLRTCIEKDSEWKVCGNAENGKEAVAKVGELKPDVVILDLQMPVMNGLEAARQIHAMSPQTAMLMFTIHNSPQLLQEARAAGIRDVISKTDQLTERLLPALKQARA
jgi:DNA-binding NarL/FixJ family response regulator